MAMKHGSGTPTGAVLLSDRNRQSQTVLRPSPTGIHGKTPLKPNENHNKRVTLTPLKTGTITGPHALPQASQTNATDKPELHIPIEVYP
ncbi:MAG: hypothetical protein LAP86_06595 [Acidobacteriia bacterium]|nr:hypothetical protein [Terriglobia bacterium]